MFGFVLRALGLTAGVACGGSAPPTAPTNEVAVAPVSSVAAVPTAPPPHETPRLPSTLKKRRPLSPSEGERFLGNVLGPYLAGNHVETNDVMTAALKFCQEAVLTEGEIRCVLEKVTEMTDIERCREPD